MQKKAQDKLFLLTGKGIQHAVSHPECPFYTTKDVLQELHYADYSPEVQKVIDLLSVGEKLDPVGSSKYKVHKYPSDIDLFEPVKACCSLNAVRLPLVHNLQQVIARLLKAENVYFSRFQCGYDRRYDIYLGKVEDGKVIDFLPYLARRELENLRDQNLLTEEETYFGLSLIEENPTPYQFYNLYWFLRDRVIVDWQPEDILRGYVQLPAGKKLYLDDALIDKSLVKLDVAALLPYPDMPGSRYVEVTNWFLVQVENSDGSVETFSIVQEDRLQSLRADIYNYEKKQPLKAAKRYWNYLFELKQTKDVLHELRKLAPLFSSYIAFLNSVITDLEQQKIMLKKYLLTENDYKEFIQETKTRMLNHAPSCYFDANLNSQLAQTLDTNKIQRTINDLTKKYLAQKRINMTRFVEEH